MPSDQSRRGLLFALTAYSLWGVAPIYFKLMGDVNAAEIIAHRIIWSLLLLLLVLLVLGELRKVRALLPFLPWLVLSAALISGNWLVFVWAVTHERISETSLGYYINPLVSVLLGRLFLAERLRPLQALAFFVAAAAVLARLIENGQLPWIALVLALCFGFYGLVRKHVAVPAVAGLMVETCIMLPVAVGYLLWLNHGNRLTFMHEGTLTDILLIFAGLVTTIPLLCFAAAVVRLPLSVIGILQYIAPTMSLLIAVFLYKEPFTQIDLLTFVLIWISLAIFSWDGYLGTKVYQPLDGKSELGNG